MLLSVGIQYIDIQHLQAVGKHIMLTNPPLMPTRKAPYFKMLKYFLCRIYYIYPIVSTIWVRKTFVSLYKIEMSNFK